MVAVVVAATITTTTKMMALLIWCWLCIHCTRTHSLIECDRFCSVKQAICILIIWALYLYDPIDASYKPSPSPPIWFCWVCVCVRLILQKPIKTMFIHQSLYISCSQRHSLHKYICIPFFLKNFIRFFFSALTIFTNDLNQGHHFLGAEHYGGFATEMLCI